MMRNHFLNGRIQSLLHIRLFYVIYVIARNWERAHIEEEVIKLDRYRCFEEEPGIGFSGHFPVWYRSHIREK